MRERERERGGAEGELGLGRVYFLILLGCVLDFKILYYLKVKRFFILILLVHEGRLMATCSKL